MRTFLRPGLERPGLVPEIILDQQPAPHHVIWWIQPVGNPGRLGGFHESPGGGGVVLDCGRDLLSVGPSRRKADEWSRVVVGEDPVHQSVRQRSVVVWVDVMEKADD